LKENSSSFSFIVGGGGGDCVEMEELLLSFFEDIINSFGILDSFFD
jgi:hypothetical protein